MNMFLTYLTSYMLFISKLIIVNSSSSTKIIIDADRGIALQQIGLYSHQMEESIFHIFIPISNHCIDSPNSIVCEYIESTNSDLVPMGTIMSFENIISAKYDRANITNIINMDIQRVLWYHQVEKFIMKTKSIVYYLENNFYVTKSVNKVMFYNPTAYISKRTLIHRALSPVTLVLKQLFYDRIGYEFLTDEQITELLTLPLLSRYENIDVNHIQESMDIFKKMILGQVVYALKSCSIVQDDKSSKDSSCLAVSTLFRRIPIGSSSIYKVYHLIPLPIVINEQKYVYSNLPKTLGINTIDKTIVKWDEEEFSSACVSSYEIQCREHPMNIPLSSALCISSILGITQDSYGKCEVTRSKHSQPSIMNIKNNIWLFYSNDESYECVSYSATSPSAKTILVNEPTIIKLPCEQAIHCSNILLPPTQCINTTVIIKTLNNTNTDDNFISTLPLKTITKRLVSIYQTATENFFIQLESDIQTSHYSIKQIIEKFLSLAISIISLIMFAILLLILKYFKTKTQKKVNKIQTNLNKVMTEYIDERLC